MKFRCKYIEDFCRALSRGGHKKWVNKKIHEKFYLVRCGCLLLLLLLLWRTAGTVGRRLIRRG